MMIESYVTVSYTLYVIFSITVIVYIALLATGVIGHSDGEYYNTGDVGMVSLILILIMPFAPLVLFPIVTCLIVEYIRKQRDTL